VAVAGAGGDDPIAERHSGYAEKVASQLRAAGVRVEVDSRNEKMNAKIRETCHAEGAVSSWLWETRNRRRTRLMFGLAGKEKTEDMGTGEFVEKIKKLNCREERYVVGRARA